MWWLKGMDDGPTSDDARPCWRALDDSALFTAPFASVLRYQDQAHTARMNAHFDSRPDNSLCLVIDVQERFQDAIPAIRDGQAVASALTTLLAGCQLLEVPTMVTRQYPKGLGDSLPYIRDGAGSQASVGDKTHFSVLDDGDLRDALANHEREMVIVAGIEAHVCVLATVDDLLRRGYGVIVAADAIASRQAAHVDMAITTMRQLGALVLPVESILFRLQRQAGVGAFKALRDLIK